MSMHLEGPWLSTTGKRRGKVKFRSAEQKRQAAQLEKDWQDLKAKLGVAEQER
jgi:N-acetylglucosamine-6-phosphate deacetylase